MTTKQEKLTNGPEAELEHARVNRRVYVVPEQPQTLADEQRYSAAMRDRAPEDVQSFPDWVRQNYTAWYGYAAPTPEAPVATQESAQ